LYTISSMRQRRIVLVIVVLAFLFSAGYLANTLVSLAKKYAVDDNLKTLDYGIKRIEAYIKVTESVLLALGDQSMDSVGIAADEMTRLKQFAKNYPEIEHVWITDTEGSITYSSYPSMIGKTMRDRDCSAFWEQVRDIGEPVLVDCDEVQTGPYRSIVVSVPLYNRGTFIGTINGSMDMHHFNKILQDMVQDKQSTVFTLFDRNSIVITSSNHNVASGTHLPGFLPAEEAMRGKRGTIDEYSPVFHDKRLYVYGPVHKANWALVLSQPQRESYAPFLNLLKGATPLLLICVLLLLGTSYQLITLENMRRIESLEFQAEKSNAVSEIAASVAHEIRNPITAIRGFMQLLANRKKDAKAQDYAQLIVEEVERVEEIIAEFLNFAKPHVFKWEKCNLATVLRSVYLLAEGRAVYNGVNVLCEEMVDVYTLGDRSQLKQVFLNLCTHPSNAQRRHSDDFFTTDTRKSGCKN
jgi:hypothetical protein